ncbi:MAG TPA: hypothetical protein VHB54_11860 [Mucilaginibacter sp.]|nr:hypothetical protein [Mucilaginibacter sp.]
MTTQFITNSTGEKTAAIVPIAEYEEFLHQHQLHLELTDEYKSMIDDMISEEESDKAEYVSSEDIKRRFSAK